MAAVDVGSEGEGGETAAPAVQASRYAPAWRSPRGLVGKREARTSTGPAVEARRRQSGRERNARADRVSTSWLAREPRAVASETRHPARASVVCSFVRTRVRTSSLPREKQPWSCVRSFVRPVREWCVSRLPCFFGRHLPPGRDHRLSALCVELHRILSLSLYIYISRSLPLSLSLSLTRSCSFCLRSYTTRYSCVCANERAKMAADSGMETCPSPEIADSRKRPLDCDAENGATKRSHYGSGGDETHHLKVLVPGMAAGAIIGKGGDTIAQLQKDTGARVKMSKSHDFYPGTTERVCLITGSLEAIMAVMDFIMDKVRQKPDPTIKATADFEHGKIMVERDKQVKILVPNSTAGMIIGKAGNYIKQIKEESGSYVQISQKAKDLSLQERCITVLGEKENNRNALMMILAKVADDPQSGTCPNVSYADVSGPVANYNPTGSPYAQAPTSTPTYTSTAGINTVSLLNGAGLSLNLNLGAAITAGTAPVTTQLLEHIKLNLRTSGFSEPAATEILSALATLAKYNILGVGIGMPSSMSYLGNPMDTTTTANGSNNNGGVFGPIGTVPALGSTSPTPRNTLDRYEPFDPFRQNNTAASAIHLNNNSFGLGTNQLSLVSKSPTQVDVNNKETKKVDIEIAEVIVGAILGPGGRALIEIQHLSGANIQISKKGMFAPGTRNRIVTITGYPNAINTAQYLIEQRISEEEAKRARQNAIANMIH